MRFDRSQDSAKSSSYLMFVGDLLWPHKMLAFVSRAVYFLLPLTLHISNQSAFDDNIACFHPRQICELLHILKYQVVHKTRALRHQFLACQLPGQRIEKCDGDDGNSLSACAHTNFCWSRSTSPVTASSPNMLVTHTPLADAIILSLQWHRKRNTYRDSGLSSFARVPPVGVTRNLSVHYLQTCLSRFSFWAYSALQLL